MLHEVCNFVQYKLRLAIYCKYLNKIKNLQNPNAIRSLQLRIIKGQVKLRLAIHLKYPDQCLVKVVI